LVKPTKAIPGYYEQERLRFIKVNSSQESVRESYIDIALDHLPYSLMERTMKNLKFFEYNGQLYVIVFYSNGASVVVEFNGEISVMESEDWEQGFLGKGLSIIACMVLAFYGLCGRRLMIRRVNN